MAVERFDPHGQALLLVAPWCLAAELLGRRAFGPRRPEWEALEDKITVGSLWEAADVPAAPSVVVDVAQAPAAAEVLDRGAGHGLGR